MERWKREGRVPGDLDPSDSTAVASTAASTRRTAAQTRPSFFLISLPFRTALVLLFLHQCDSYSLSFSLPPLPMSSGMSFHIRRPQFSLLHVSRKPPEVWLDLTMANEFPIWMHTLTLSPLSATLYLSPRATHSTSPPLCPPLLHSLYTHGKFWWDSEEIAHPSKKKEKKERQDNIKGRKWIVSVSRLPFCMTVWHDEQCAL